MLISGKAWGTIDFKGDVMLLTALPLLAIILIIYNLLAFAAPMLSGEWQGMEVFLAQGVGFTMFSGDDWHFAMGDLILVVSLVLLFIEIVKATSTGAASIINHGLSMLVFVICLIEFVIVQGFANSVFFLITVMALLDVIAGFTITIVAAKRDLGVAPGIVGTN